MGFVACGIKARISLIRMLTRIDPHRELLAALPRSKRESALVRKVLLRQHPKIPDHTDQKK